MIRSYFPQTSDRIPVGIAVLSLAPLLFAGPLSTIISYHPWWDLKQQTTWVMPIFGAVVALLICAAFVVGVARKFPRWCYPYAFYLILALTFLATYAVNGTPWDVNHEADILLAVVAAEALVMAAVPFLRRFYANIRRDWTLLSYGMYAFSAFLLASQDHDEAPRLTLLVMLPSLIILAGAFLHLRLASASWRFAVLIISMLAGTLVWAIPIFDGMIGTWIGFMQALTLLLIAWGILGGLLLAPILIGVFTRPKPAV